MRGLREVSSTLLILSEDDIRRLITAEAAVSAVEAAFAAYDKGEASAYPVLRESVNGSNAIFGVKSGFDRSAKVLGLKAGGYWPGNADRGLGNHQSTILLLDVETGQALAVVSANLLTGLRTGAAGALAAKFLAREDARTIGIIGTGVQAVFQLKATASVRALQRVFAWDPSQEKLASFRRIVQELGLEFVAAERAEVVRESDIVVTVTPSTSPLVEKEWVRPGTHINAMGADTVGKQELDPAIVVGSNVFVDSIEQAVSIGECQHAYKQGSLKKADIRGVLGGLITGRIEGRRSETTVTVFDGTGIALQDLAVAGLACRMAEKHRVGSRIEM